MSEPKIHKVDWRADAFLAGTSMLGANEGWLYTIIINLIYSHGEAIDADLKWLGKVANMHGNAVRAALLRLISLGKVSETNGKLMAKRCRNELETAVKRVRSAHDNAAKGGRPRKQIKGVAKPSGLSGAKPTTTTTIEGSSSDTDVSSDLPKKRALTRAQSFEAWWLGYPHKVGKGAAQAKFDIAFRGGTSLDELNAGVERYKRDKPEDRGWMNPSTWLFQKRWMDEPAPTLVADNTGPAAPMPDLTPHELFRGRLNHLRDKGRWYPERWGPPPDDAGCQAPHDLLVEYGFRERAA